MIQYNGQYVDERYSSIFEPNLFTNAWLVPGATYTDKYFQGPAGGLFVHKIKNVAAAKPGTPGRDYTHENAQDDLIQIVMNNNFQKSRKIYGVQAASVAAPLANEHLSVATQEVREGREYAALAALLSEGKTSASTTSLTEDNVKAEILNARAEISKAKGRANVILCSPDTYAKILTAAGKEFTPNRNERIQLGGQIGEWFGFTIIECNALASPDAIEYYDYSGTKKTIAAGTLEDVDFVMYYSEALSVVDNLNSMRILDAVMDFTGSVAQIEVNTGIRVTNSELVRVKKHA